MADVNEVVFHYEEDPDCRTCYANGAFGGVGPKGEIVMNLFLDHLLLPKTETVVIVDKSGATSSKGGSREERFEQDGKMHVERRVVARITMNMGVAQSVARWLDDKVKEVMNRRDMGRKQ